jgi:lipoyl(octanoyl) transferase
MKDCIAAWLGTIPYSRALELQMNICNSKKHGFLPDVLLLLEHPPVITLGRNANRQNLLVAEEFLKARGVELWDVDRGGDITFHGPGQLVGYPILSLEGEERDVRKYMQNLEESLIRLLARYGICGERNADYTGVWTGAKKIAAMGVHLSRWITRHGFAFNVATDLSFYDLIVPCGIKGKGVTSMRQLLEFAPELREVADNYILEFAFTFNRNMMVMDEFGLREAIVAFDHQGNKARVSAFRPAM